MNKFLATIIALGSITAPAFATDSVKEVRTTREAIEIELQEKQIEKDLQTLKELDSYLTLFTNQVNDLNAEIFDRYFEAQLTASILTTATCLVMYKKGIPVSTYVLSSGIIFASAFFYEELTTSDQKTAATQTIGKIELTQEVISNLQKNITEAQKRLENKKQLLKAAKAEFEN